MKLKQLALNPYLHLALLALVVALTFSRTLGTYFLADDFGEIAYVSRITSGDLGMLAANFTGNYMQIPSMSVWRPWLLVSLLTDCLVWGANPFGYYLTNFLSYIAVVLSLYLFIRNLTTDWCSTRSSLAAFFSALIFALNPLHCESISWVVGRVDIVCAVFYLACLNLFILAMRSDESAHDNGSKKNQTRKLTILSVVCFWLAMWTKEMAIGAPVMAFAIALLWGKPPLRLKNSLRLCLPLIVSTIVYFILRYLALGTLLGGYTQGIGDAQAAGALSHWLDPDTARRLFFPLAHSIYDAKVAQNLGTLLALLFTALTALSLLRVGSLQAPLRWIALLPIWLLTALAPIYKLWGLGYELEGARFVFFATMPLATLFPVILFAPHSGGAAAKSEGDRRLRPAFAALTVLALIGLALVYGKLAARLNLEWVHAGKEVREFAEQSRALAATNQNKTSGTIILGIPKRRGGAHMVLNGTTFKMLLQPPFAPNKVEDKFLTFDPIIFGNSDFINASRFKKALPETDGSVYFWDSERRSFNTVKPDRTAGEGSDRGAITLDARAPKYYLHTAGHAVIEESSGSGKARAAVGHITAGDGIAFRGLDINPIRTDFAAVKLTCLDNGAASGSLPAEAVLSCLWQEDPDRRYSVSRTFPTRTGEEQIVYLRLSSNYRWYTQGSLGQLFLELPHMPGVAVSEFKLLPAAAVCPQIELTDASQKTVSQIGINTIKADETTSLRVKLPTLSGSDPNGAGVTEIQLELSKPNAFFANFSDSDQGKATDKTLKLPAPDRSSNNNNAAVTFTLPPIPRGANYEVRARLLDARGRTVGDVSDTLVLNAQ